jgi:hypothetical protein
MEMKSVISALKKDDSDTEYPVEQIATKEELNHFTL